MALITRQDTRQEFPSPSEVPTALRLSVASTGDVSLRDPLLVPLGGWAQVHGVVVKKEGLLCFSHIHRWKPKRSPRTPSLDDDEDDIAEGQTLYKSCWASAPYSDHSCIYLRLAELGSHTLLWFSDVRLGKRIWRVYNQKWLCSQLDACICPRLTSIGWFGHLGTLRKPSWKEPPCSWWHNQSPRFGIVCKFPPCRMKLSNDICCLRGQSWTRSIKTNVSLNANWENCSEAIWRASYFALERFLWRLNTQQYLILSKIAVYCLFN